MCYRQSILNSRVNQSSLLQDFPLLSDPFKVTIPGELLNYDYCERGPVTVEQLLGSEKLSHDGVVKSM